MIDGFHAEVLMAGGYALFLVAVATMLEWLAEHSHHRSEQMRVTGFKFHQELDHWECPTGQFLRRHSTDHQLNMCVTVHPGTCATPATRKSTALILTLAGKSNSVSTPGSNRRFTVSIAVFRWSYCCSLE